MSHFIISENSTCIFGTPNGQASTQLLQAMQRGLRALCTTPSSVRLMASAGQTSAHVGESQCMQITGTVCTEIGRWTYCSWIIECPLCVSHSEQAATHDWHPMQRFGSTKNSISTHTSRPGDQRRRNPGRSSSWLRSAFRVLTLRDLHRADFVLRDLRHRVLRGDGELVR